MRLILLIFACLSICRAALVPKFYFQTCPEILENALKAGQNPLRIISELTRDIKYFQISASVMEESVINSFFESIQKVCSLLYHSEDIDYSSPEMILFSSQLLIVSEKFIDQFHGNLVDIVGILISTSDTTDESRLRQIISECLPKLKTVPLLKLLKYLKNNINVEKCFIPFKFLKYCPETKLKNFFDDYISEFVRKIPERTFYASFKALEHMLKLVYFISADVQLSLESYGLLIGSLQRSMTMTNVTNALDGILNSLDSILYNSTLPLESPLDLYIIDFIFDPRITRNLNADVINQKYLSLMIECCRRSKPYFKSTLMSTRDVNMLSFRIYIDQMKSLTLVQMCVIKLSVLNENSTEADFRVGLSSILNLKKIYVENMLLLRYEPNLLGILNALSVRISNVYLSFSNENYLIALKVVTHASILCFHMSVGDNRMNSAGNLAYGLGRMMSEKNTPNFPTELIAEVKPFVDEVAVYLLELCKDLQTPMSAIDLAAYINFVHLHSSIEFSKSAFDLLSFYLITSIPIERKGYAYVKDLGFIDEANVMRAGFMHHFKKCLMNSDSSQAVHFQEYYNFLMSKRYLSKTDQAIINAHFTHF